jgi:hypothetical protein
MDQMPFKSGLPSAAWDALYPGPGSPPRLKNRFSMIDYCFSGDRLS